ncbi:MAG: nucleotidyltransferase family protein [Phenylobacterium sp.]
MEAAAHGDCQLVPFQVRANEALPPEFLLAAACCSWPPSAMRDAAVRRAAGAPIDWKRFLQVLTRQRVGALARDGLMRAEIPVPPAATAAMADIAKQTAVRNLQYAGEARALRRLFDDSGVPILFFKGATLARRAYGSIDLKHGRDIDILVSRDHVREAVGLLEQVGYRPVWPIPGSEPLFSTWLDTAKEFEFLDPARGTRVELHWALVDNGWHRARLAAHLTRQAVDIGNGVVLETLGDDILFVYLCIHGARSGWFRLKWLADVAAILEASSAADFDRYVALARDCDATPCLAQAALLCGRLFPGVLSAERAAPFRRSLRHRWLERTAMTMMTRGGGRLEVSHIPFGSFPTWVSAWLLGRSWRYLLAELRLAMTSLTDMRQAPLPRPLWFLYPLLRLPLSAVRRIKDRGLGKAPPELPAGPTGAG